MSKICNRCCGDGYEKHMNNDGFSYSNKPCPVCGGSGYADLTPDITCTICGGSFISWQHDGMKCLTEQASKVPDLLRRIERLEQLHMTDSESTTAGAIRQSEDDVK
jgi:DnaJ-class molecular chaperone